ncbi:MAG: glycosyltransferase [Candidatus Omnitrophota bacterium]
MRDIVYLLNNVLLGYFLAINSFYALLLLLSIPQLYCRYKQSRKDDKQVLNPIDCPPVSIIIPAYNEAANIIVSVQAVLNLSYPKFEVIVVNDGSADATLPYLVSTFQMVKIQLPEHNFKATQPIKESYRSKIYPNLILIDKQNGGKGDALNVGISVAASRYFLAVDADTIIEKGALQPLVRAMLTEKDAAAICGTIRIANGCNIEKGEIMRTRFPTDIFPAVQAIEYLRIFLFGKLGWNRFGGDLIISGAFGFFRKDQVVACGGYEINTVGEDIELTVRMHRKLREKGRRCRVIFVSDPIAWTEAPPNIASLVKQRERWHRGLIDTIQRHKIMFFNPRYKAVGLISFPFYAAGEMFAPIMECAGVITMITGLLIGVINYNFVMIFLFSTAGITMLLTVCAIIIEEVVFKTYRNKWVFLRMLVFSLLEYLGYRQIVIFSRILAFFKKLQGVKSWGKVERLGFRPMIKPINTTPLLSFRR